MHPTTLSIPSSAVPWHILSLSNVGVLQTCLLVLSVREPGWWLSQGHQASSLQLLWTA